jgi:hypothetical protein
MERVKTGISGKSAKQPNRFPPFPGLGKRQSVPLSFRGQPHGHAAPSRRQGARGDVARDILALTKMNWNSTQFDGALPIPIRAARQVGKVLHHVPIWQKEATEYPYYM